MLQDQCPISISAIADVKGDGSTFCFAGPLHNPVYSEELEGLSDTRSHSHISVKHKTVEDKNSLFPHLTGEDDDDDDESAVLYDEGV